MKKRLPLLLSICLYIQAAYSQCPGTWNGDVSGLDYLCANGPFLQYDSPVACPAAAQSTYHFTESQQFVRFHFSAFGSQGYPGQSRMAVFLNGGKIDLRNACSIAVGCQTPSGAYSISTGCLVDSVSGSDGGIAGYIVLSAANYSLPSIDSIGVAVYEPGASGTIFQIDSCISSCMSVGIEALTVISTVSIYPNPVNDLLYIKVANARLQTIRIYGVSGNQVYSMPFKTIVDVSALSSGAYFIEIIGATEVVRKKFVKM